VVTVPDNKLKQWKRNQDKYQYVNIKLHKWQIVN
jgi:hypothetical protein